MDYLNIALTVLGSFVVAYALYVLYIGTMMCSDICMALKVYKYLEKKGENSVEKTTTKNNSLLYIIYLGKMGLDEKYTYSIRYVPSQKYFWIYKSPDIYDSSEKSIYIVVDSFITKITPYHKFICKRGIELMEKQVKRYKLFSPN